MYKNNNDTRIKFEFLFCLYLSFGKNYSSNFIVELQYEEKSLYFLILHFNVSANLDVSVGFQKNFVKNVGVVMPWNGGFFPDDHTDPLIDTFNKNIYEQYKTYSNKNEALLACHLDDDCPWVFDEKCDGIGPFVIGFRAKKTFQCPKYSRKAQRRRLANCNLDCIYEKGIL